MSRLSSGLLATAVVIAVALASVRVQLVQAGRAAFIPTETRSLVATGGDVHSGN
jgi:hypothetical protein